MIAASGRIPLKCPDCPEVIDVSWSPHGLACAHRGTPCASFPQLVRESVLALIDSNARAQALSAMPPLTPEKGSPS